MIDHKNLKEVLQILRNIKGQVDRLAPLIENNFDMTPKEKADLWNTICPFYPLNEYSDYLDGVISTFSKNLNLKRKEETKNKERVFKDKIQDTWETE